MDTNEGAEKRIRSYVIRSSRMRDSQKRAFDDFGAAYLVDTTAPLDERAFGNENPLIVEIGFGMGDATLEIALADPGRNYVGIEVHRPGIGKLLKGIADRGIENLRIAHGDAAVVIPVIFRDESVSGFHVFFPDPWPKKRHHKRRLMSPAFASLLAAKLAPGGYIYMVTDWEEYAERTLAILGGIPCLENPYDSYAERKPWRPVTKFEKKGDAEGRSSFDIFFIKKKA